MNRLSSLLLILLFVLSLFIVSHSFAGISILTFYFSVIGCTVMVIVALLQGYKKNTLRFSVSEILLTSFILFGISYGAYCGSLSAEWVISALSLLLFYLLVKRMKLNLEWLYGGIVILVLIQALYGLGQYVYWFTNYAANFRMSGSFDNPAGFAAALSVGFPFALFLVLRKQIYWRIISYLAIPVLILAVALSQSRAGVISFIFISGLWAFHLLNLKWLKCWSGVAKVFVGATFMIAILVGLYFAKKDSADGRLLIWQCSAKMIIDKPLLGHGVGGFQREYMLYQADYFKTHSGSSYLMLADIVKHPFNEFLLLFVEQGLVGALFLGLFLYYLIREYRRSKSNERFYALLCLAGIAVFGCFSYPLGYPFIRLGVVFSLAIVMRNEPKKLVIPRRIFCALKPMLLIVCVGLLVISGEMFYDEYHWNIIAKRSLAGETKKVMPDYELLYKTMNRNGLFLYNYGAELNYIGKWDKSIVLLKECANFYNDIDLQLLLADNYTQLKQYPKAEKCFQLASEMIPNRFIPLYRLAKLYQETNRVKEAKTIANEIINKPIKIISPDVSIIKTEMEELLNN